MPTPCRLPPELLCQIRFSPPKTRVFASPPTQRTGGDLQRQADAASQHEAQSHACRSARRLGHRGCPRLRCGGNHHQHHATHLRYRIGLQLALPESEVLRIEPPRSAVGSLGLARSTLRGQVLGPPGADIFPASRGRKASRRQSAHSCVSTCRRVSPAPASTGRRRFTDAYRSRCGRSCEIELALR